MNELIFILAILISVVLFILAIYLILYFVLPMLGYSPAISSNQKSIENMIKIAEIKKTDKIIDLGCGNGSLLLELAKHSNNITGLEINPFLVWLVKIRLLSSRNRKNVSIHRRNIFEQNLSEYDKIYCYLGQKAINDLSKKFKKEMRPGAHLITNTFHPEDWTSQKEITRIQSFQL